MISTPTVLVLGAGASQPCEYPTGAGLRDYILGGGLDSLKKEILLELNSSGINMKNFLFALKRARLPSIDSFLEHRRAFEQIGKIAITKAVVDMEIEDNLDTEDWYQYLFQHMFTSFDNFDENTLGIITFNYDRSLEYFLFLALRSVSGKSKKVCMKKLSSIPIIHVHGKVGNLPWEGGAYTRPYQSKIDATNIIKSSENIKIIHETHADKDEEFVEARKLLASAEKVLFLGFGYHKENLARLKIDQLPDGIASGTSYGMTDLERINCQRKRCLNKIRLTFPGAVNQKIHKFLREHINL